MKIKVTKMVPKEARQDIPNRTVYYKNVTNTKPYSKTDTADQKNQAVQCRDPWHKPTAMKAIRLCTPVVRMIL